MRRAAFLLAFAIALPARAQDAGSGSEPTAAGDSPTLPGALVAAGEVGAIFPQPFTQYGSHVAFGIELGYRLPFLGQRFDIMLDIGYSPPGNGFTEKRADIEYEATARTKQLHFSLGP